MSFKTALTNLANISVTGITHSYGIEDIPESLSRSQLPVLLLMPIDTQEEAYYRESGKAFEGAAFGEGAKAVQYVLTHLLLIAPVGMGKGIRAHLPLLVDCIDAYMDALSADLTLGDSLEEAAEIRIEAGIYSLGKQKFYGCAFRHRWHIAY